MKRFQWLIPLLLLMILPACAQDQTPAASVVTTPTSAPEPGPAVTQYSSSNNFSGTAWKLVKLQTTGETMDVPDDPSKHTITFGSNGRVTGESIATAAVVPGDHRALVNCNSGPGRGRVPSVLPVPFKTRYDVVKQGGIVRQLHGIPFLNFKAS